VRFGGRQGRWTNLQWPVPINEGCILNVYIYSGDTLVGWAEVPAHEIVRVPLDDHGLTVLNLPILDVYQLRTGRVQLQLQLHNVMVEDYEKLAYKPKIVSGLWDGGAVRAVPWVNSLPSLWSATPFSLSLHPTSTPLPVQPFRTTMTSAPPSPRTSTSARPTAPRRT